MLEMTVDDWATDILANEDFTKIRSREQVQRIVKSWRDMPDSQMTDRMMERVVARILVMISES